MMVHLSPQGLCGGKWGKETDPTTEVVVDKRAAGQIPSPEGGTVGWELHSALYPGTLLQRWGVS